MNSHVTVREVEPRSAVGRPEIVDERRTRLRFAAVLAAVVAAMALALWGFTDSLVGAEDVQLPRLAVPSVEALSLADATARLEDTGFTVTVLYQPNEDKPKGEVIGQRPTAGYKADQGDLITILVSDGPLGWTVPSIVGLQVEDALISLGGVEVALEINDVHDETIPDGEVIESMPSEGSRVGPTTKLRLTVSAGPAPRIVPEIVNQPIEQGLVAIGRAGLMVGKITEVARPELAPGTIVELGVAPGTGLARDTPVDITVSVAQDMRPVPYLTGLLRSSAEEMIRDAGLVAQVVTSEVPPGSSLAGRVTVQGTAPAVRLPRGSVVSITVGVAAP